jgi:hypothetical protein
MCWLLAWHLRQLRCWQDTCGSRHLCGTGVLAAAAAVAGGQAGSVGRWRWTEVLRLGGWFGGASWCWLGGGGLWQQRCLERRVLRSAAPAAC